MVGGKRQRCEWQTVGHVETSARLVATCMGQLDWADGCWEMKVESGDTRSDKGLKTPLLLEIKL